MYRRYEKKTPQHPCPTCKKENKLTDYEKSRGYQCRDCTLRDAYDYGNENY